MAAEIISGHHYGFSPRLMLSVCWVKLLNGFVILLELCRGSPLVSESFWILCFEPLHLPISQRIPGLGRTDSGQDPLSNSKMRWLDFHIRKKPALWNFRDISQGIDLNFMRGKNREMGYQRDNRVVIAK